MTEKKYIDPVLGEVTLRKSLRARGRSLRVHPLKGIMVTVPYWVPYRTGIAFLESRREWVLEVQARQREKARGMNAELPEGETVESLRKRARAELPPRLMTLADKYGFNPGRIAIKHNISNWGSCSRKGNINLNLNLLRLERPLQDYVLLHELCHLTHPNHGPQFHRLLEDLLTSHFTDEGYAESLAAAKKTRARYPLTHVLEKAVKQYKLL